jgi:glycosyltransferase involved in cell wall biosynthesis
MKKIKKSISVFLPALNEEENIKSCVLSVKNYLNRRFKDYEILVIASGSTDNTAKIVLGIAKKDNHIKLVNYKKILGYGTALRSGFTHSSKKLIFYTDSDNQFNIEDMDRLLPLLETYDIISGFRVNRQDPPMRIFIAFVYNILIRVLFGLKIRDIDASFKLYEREVFDKIRLKSKTGLIDAEVLIKAQKNGFLIGQIGVRHYPRIKGRTVYGLGKRNTFVRPKVIFDVLREMKSLWRDLR